VQVTDALNTATTALNALVTTTVTSAGQNITALQQAALASINTAVGQATTVIQDAQSLALANITAALGSAQTALAGQFIAAQVCCHSPLYVGV
jgi:hypothetical protein